MAEEALQMLHRRKGSMLTHRKIPADFLNVSTIFGQQKSGPSA